MDKMAPQKGSDTKPVLMQSIENRILRNGEIHHKTEAMAVFRDIGDTGIDERLRRLVSEIAAIEKDAAAVRRPDPRQRLAQLGLPVAFHTGNAHDFTLGHSQRHTPECVGGSIRAHP